MIQPARMPAARGGLTILHKAGSALRQAALDGELIRDDVRGHYWKRNAGRVRWRQPQTSAQQRFLAWLRDNVHHDLPSLWYRLVIGHDIHLAVHATLQAVHFHHDQPDPFTGALGWRENLGLVSQHKIGESFRDYLSALFVTDATTIGDFKFHRVGTDATAEANTQTALIADAGLEATGDQANPTAPTYRSIGTVTADTTETWNEHSLRNATGATGGVMLDRSVIASPPSVIANDTVQFTHTTTFSAEA